MNIEGKIENPISDDTLDYVESQVEKMTEADNLGEKISIHQQLKDTIERLENEINELAERIDKIDTDTFRELNTLSQSQILDDIENPNDGIINIEQLVDSLQNEEILQNKVTQFERIADIVKSCKLKCIDNEVKLRKCN